MIRDEGFSVYWIAENLTTKEILAEGFDGQDVIKKADKSGKEYILDSVLKTRE